MLNKKAQFQGFKWLLSIIIGAVILFLAFYFAGLITGTGGEKESLTTAQQISIFLDPFAFSGIAEASSKEISMPSITLMNFSCDSNADLEKISVSIKKSAKGKATFVRDYNIYNKYIFSNSNIETKKFYIFAKPFAMPFHIANVIYIIDRQYCFVKAPGEIKKEIQDLNITSIEFENSAGACDSGSVSACFGTGSCDIYVYGQNLMALSDESQFDYGYVSKKGEKLEFASKALMYAAIFSDSKIYRCNMQRLNKKFSDILSIYKEKEALLELRECSMGNAPSNLNNLEADLMLMKNNQPLTALFLDAKALANTNSVADCPIF